MNKHKNPLVSAFARSLVVPIRRGALSIPSRPNVKKYVTKKVDSAHASTSPVVTKYLKRSLKVGPVVSAVNRALDPIFKRLEKRSEKKKEGKPRAARKKKSSAKKSPDKKARSPMSNQQSLPEFAKEVLKVARSSKVTPWHGGVFVAEIYEAMHPDMPLSTFKERLLQAHQSDLLTLSRADLVGSMPASKVAASEIVRGSASLHLLRLDE